MFHDLYVDLFGGDRDLEAYKLLQGIDNTSLVAGRALWALSQKAKAVSEVATLILETDSADVMDALGQSEAGRAFVPEIQTFLEGYGKRSDTVIEMADPSWSEEPKTAIELLKNYMGDSAEDPNIRWRELVAEREQLVAEAREKLASYPDPVKQQFEMLLPLG
jgi:pyruvate,water dikinase